MRDFVGKVQWERHARIEGLFDDDGNLQDITKLVSQFPSDFSPSSLGETSYGRFKTMLDEHRRGPAIKASM